MNKDGADGDVDALIKARSNTAGRFGFVIGCCVALTAVVMNLWRAPRPWMWSSILLAILMAALNIPLGIALGLWAEHLTRRPRADGR